MGRRTRFCASGPTIVGDAGLGRYPGPGEGRDTGAAKKARPPRRARGRLPDPSAVSLARRCLLRVRLEERLRVLRKCLALGRLARREARGRFFSSQGHRRPGECRARRRDWRTARPSASGTSSRRRTPSTCRAWRSAHRESGELQEGCADACRPSRDRSAPASTTSGKASSSCCRASTVRRGIGEVQVLVLRERSNLRHRGRLLRCRHELEEVRGLFANLGVLLLVRGDVHDRFEPAGARQHVVMAPQT